MCSSDLWLNVFTFLFMIFIFIPFLLSSKVVTIPEFLARRYGPSVRQIFAFITVVANIVIFMAAVHAGLIWLAVLGILASVVGCYYYIRVVKLMYFDAPAEALDPTAGGSAVRFVTAVTALIILLFILIPGPLLATAEAAATSLFPG